MAKIFYSLSGEGRGHATRVRGIVEQLRQEHEVVLFASSVAYDLLSAAYENCGNVSVRRIPGLQFAYRGGRLDYFRSVCRSLPYLWRLPRLVRSMVEAIREHQPDLAIVDFEPSLPRAAKKCGVPMVSFDHQHFLVVSDLSDLPTRLRWKAWAISLSVRMFCKGEKGTIVSSFFRPPLKRRWKDAVQIGVLLRPAILNAVPNVGEHVLVYLRRFGSSNVLDALRQCGRPVRVYGLGRQPVDGNLEYFDVDEHGFVRDLATCYALISNAGNQLVGEALYLRKPMLALPEPGNFEQSVNAHFLRAGGGGDWAECEQLDGPRLRRFLDAVPRLREQIQHDGLNGNDDALEAIRRFLPQPALPRPSALVDSAA